MSDVIIDGCNVAECEHLLSDGKRKAICKSGGSCRVYKSCLCVDNSDCHFKQLQRAKAENEKLKRLINIHLTTFDKCCVNGLIMSNNMSEVLKLRDLKATDKIEFKQYFKAENDKLKAENEKLKNRNIELEAYFKVNEDFQKAWQELNSIHNDLQKVYQNEHCDNLKYKQALEEIKTYADTQIFSCMGCDAYNECKNCENKNARQLSVKTNKKINEVLND